MTRRAGLFAKFKNTLPFFFRNRPIDWMERARSSRSGGRGLGEHGVRVGVNPDQAAAFAIARKAVLSRDKNQA